MTPIVNSLWVGVLVTLAMPAGFLARALVCLLMRVAHIPGHYLWRIGAARGNSLLRICGAVLSWLGQCYVSLAFAISLICLVRLFFGTFSIASLIKGLVWAEALFLAVAPAYLSYRAFIAPGGDGRATESEARFYETFAFTFIPTLAGYLMFVLWPKAAMYGWGWLPFIRHLFPTHAN